MGPNASGQSAFRRGGPAGALIPRPHVRNAVLDLTDSTRSMPWKEAIPVCLYAVNAPIAH